MTIKLETLLQESKEDAHTQLNEYKSQSSFYVIVVDPEFNKHLFPNGQMPL